MKFSKPYSLKELSAWLNREFLGDTQQVITGLNELHRVEEGDITFVDHPKYFERVLNSHATTIIINSKEVQCPEGKALIFSDDPFSDFNKIILEHRPVLSFTEMVSKKAEIGKGTIIQPGAFIGDFVKIGENCIIQPNVTIYPYTEIGNNVVIHSGSVIGADACYFQKKDGQYRKFNTCGKVVIDDDVEVGACCTIDAGVTSETKIGAGTKFDNHVQVGHDTVIGKNCLIGCHCSIAGVSDIEDNVVLWAKVAVNKDITLKSGVVLLATSGTDKSLEAGTYFGIPAAPVTKAWREKAALRMLPDLLQKMNLIDKK
ncbi:MAG: LpxD N-terminal domain-containing protein [Bacteroidales bacterium]|nr:LpxD N-terminal domain-containing protein [Bacteroidales bacterium]